MTTKKAQAAATSDAAEVLAETRSQLQALQRKRQENRAAYQAAISNRDIKEMRKLKVELAEINVDIDNLSAVLEADLEIVADLRREVMSEEQRRARRQGYVDIKRAIADRDAAVDELVENLTAACLNWRKVQEGHDRAVGYFRSIAPPSLRWDNPHARSLILYEDFLGKLNNVLPFDSIVRRIFKEGFQFGRTDQPTEKLLSGLKQCAKLVVAEYQRQGLTALGTAAILCSDSSDGNSPEAA